MPQQQTIQTEYPRIGNTPPIREKIDAIVAANKAFSQAAALTRKAEGILQEKILYDHFDTEKLSLFYKVNEVKATFPSRDISVHVVTFHPHSFIEFLNKPILGVKYSKAEGEYRNPEITPKFIYDTLEKIIALKYNGVHEYGNKTIYVYNGLDKAFLERKDKESLEVASSFRIMRADRDIAFFSSNSTLTTFYMDLVHLLQPQSMLETVNFFRAGDAYYWGGKLSGKDIIKQVHTDINVALPLVNNSLKKLLELVFSPTYERLLGDKIGFLSVKTSLGTLFAKKIVEKHGTQVLNKIVEQMSDVESYYEFISGRTKLAIINMDYFTFVGYMQRIVETERRFLVC
jgi:hypothetical protein